MNGPYRKWLHLIKKHCYFLCTIIALLSEGLTGVSQAGFIVNSTQPLDGQTVDWITITTVNGRGTLTNGVLSVGFYDAANPAISTNAGNFTIQESAVFTADIIDSSSGIQGRGTLNLGPTMIIKTGGKAYLNHDTLNARGRSDYFSESLRMIESSQLVSYISDLVFENDVSVKGSTMALTGGTFDFGDKLLVRDSGAVTLTNVMARHQGLGNPNNTARVVVESQSSLNLDNSSLDLVSGGGNSVDGQNILIKSKGNVQVTGAGSAVTARRVSADDSDSLYSQTGGSLNTHALTSGNNGEIRLNGTLVNSGYISVNGRFNAMGATLNLAGGNFSGTNGTTSLTVTTLGITGGGDIDLTGTSGFTAVDSNISADLFLLRDTAALSLSSTTGSSLDIKDFRSTGTNNIRISGYDINIDGRFDVGVEGGTASQVTLTNSTLDTANEVRILNNTNMTAQSSQIMFGNEGRISGSNLALNTNSALFFEDFLDIYNSSSLSVTHSTLAHKNDGIATDGTLGSIGVIGGSRLDLNNATLDLSSGNEQRILVNTQGTVTAANSIVKAGNIVVDDSGSLYSQTGGSLNLAGGNFSGTNGTTSLTGTTLGITGGGGIDLTGTSRFTAVDSNISADLFLLRGTAGLSLTSTTGSGLDIKDFRSTGTNNIQISGYDINIDGRFDVGVEGGTASQVTLTNSTLDTANEVRILNNTNMTAQSSQIMFGNEGRISGSNLALNTNSALFFEDFLDIYNSSSLSVTHSTLAHKNDGIAADGTLGSIVVKEASRLDLSNASLDLGSGNEQRILVNTQGTVTAANSIVKAGNIVVDDSGSLYSQTGGSLNLAGGNFSGTNGITSLTGTTLGITGGGDIDLMGTSKFTAVDSNISADLFLLRGTAGLSLTSTTGSGLDINDFRSTGTNNIQISGYDINIDGRFDVGVEGGTASQVTLTNSTLDTANEVRILNNTNMTAQSSQIMFGNEGRISGSNLVLNTNSALFFEDFLDIYNSSSLSVTDSTLAHKNDGIAADGTLGSIGVKAQSRLDLSNASLDLSSGDEQRILVNTQGTVTAANSTITGKEILVESAGSTMEISSNTNLTTESLTVRDNGVFTANDSTVHVTGNTTRIEAGGSLFVNGGNYQEDGDFIIDGGSLKAQDVAITIGRDMIVTGNASVEVSVGDLFIGDDFLFDPIGTGFFSMESARILMQGTSDDEGTGHAFKMADGISLGGLCVAAAVDLVLNGNLAVKDLNLLGGAAIHLNGFDLTVTSLFSGDLDQVITTGGGNFIYDSNQTIPEPSTLLLMGLGLLVFSKSRQKHIC